MTVKMTEREQRQGKNYNMGRNKKEMCAASKSVIRKLAGIYPQLYLKPGPESELIYPDVVQRGKAVPHEDLSHFRTSAADECRMVQTPAGEVRAVTLGDRRDFEVFLQIMANRCKKVAIPATQGAQFIDGIINRGRIERHKEEYYRAAKEKGEQEPGIFEWLEEQRRFTSDKRNYTDALLVLSIGPYSGVPAAKVGLSEERWIACSHEIRLYHECTHFIAYRLYPEKCEPVRDEVVADAVGIYAAFGRVDRGIAECCLGISEGRYTGGRLENYTENPEDELEMIRDTLLIAEKIANDYRGIAPLELACCILEALPNYTR